MSTFLRKKNLDSRYDYYYNIKDSIDYLIKNASDTCLTPIKKNEYKINDNIHLITKIGSVSVYGSIFLSNIKIKKKILKFVTKIQLINDDSIKELKYLTKTTITALKTNNIHLPLLYNYMYCNKFDKYNQLLPSNIINADYDSSKYFSFFVELANGDLEQYIKNNQNINFDYFINIVSQCYISILSCHSIGIFHNDSHMNNFLYHKISNKKGCIEYKYKDLIFYIENIGLIFTIWDFGLSKDIDYTTNIMKDYQKLNASLIYLIQQFLNNEKLSKYIDMINIYYVYYYNTDYDFIKHLIKDKLLFSEKPIGKIIKTIIIS